MHKFKKLDKIRVLNEASEWGEDDSWEEAIYLSTKESWEHIYISKDWYTEKEHCEIKEYNIEEVFNEKLEEKEEEISYLKDDIKSLETKIIEIQSRCKHEEYKEIDKSWYVGISWCSPWEKRTSTMCECKVCGYEAMRKEGEYEPMQNLFFK